MNQPPMYEQSRSPEPVSGQETSLTSRLLNIVAAPGEVFEELNRFPFRAANWVVPALIFVVASWACSLLIFTQPAIEQQLRDISAQAVDKAIANAKMSEAQADQTRVMAEKWAVLGAKISAVSGPPIMAIVVPFGWGLLIWLIGGKMMKGGFGYLKGVEVAGLSLILSTLQVIVQSLLILVTTNLWAATSPTLFISHFDPQNPTHSFLALLNVMTLWILAIRALGAARLARGSFVKAAAWVFGLWITYSALMIGIGAAVRQATSK